MHNNYSLKDLISDFGETDSPTKSSISMQEVEEISRKYFEEFNTDVIDKDTTLPDEPKHYFSALFDNIRLPSFLNWSMTGPSLTPATQNEIVIHNNKNNTKPKLIIINDIKKSVSDPLSIIIILLVGVFSYIYFVNDFMCQIFGLL